ncbi:MAG TPA: trehalose-6-phosphate synthase [Gaiellaceae bacterium]
MSPSTTPRRKLLVVFNRAPVSYTRDAEGKRVARRGGGGVVTALGGLLAHHDVTWVASAMTEEDRAVAAEQDGSFVEETATGASYRLRLVAHDPAAYERFYNVLANPTLWFLQHYLWGLGSAPDFGPELHEAWSDGYVPVNEGLAAAALEELDREPDAAVLFHDYHLYLAPRLVREARPEVVTSHFLHIPWPEPDYWHALPPELRVAVHEGLLANDVVGFHTERWRRAFLLSVERLLGARVDREAGTVEHLGRTTRTVAHPISVDPAEFDRLRDDPGVLEREAALVARRPEQLVLRVDRTDPSKNIVRGFRAYALLLERHPELHGRVGMVAQLAPSRQDIPEYADYVGAVETAAQEVNERFGRADWQPVELDVADDFLRSIAGYKQFDVLFVNAVFDGLNLVTKEAFLVNGRDGALVLSENAGVHEELGEWAITVNPIDVSGQAEALYEALTLGPGERRRRGDAIREHVRAHDITAWVEAQLADLETVRSSS